MTDHDALAALRKAAWAYLDKITRNGGTWSSAELDAIAEASGWTKTAGSTADATATAFPTGIPATTTPPHAVVRCPDCGVGTDEGGHTWGCREAVRRADLAALAGDTPEAKP